MRCSLFSPRSSSWSSPASNQKRSRLAAKCTFSEPVAFSAEMRWNWATRSRLSMEDPGSLGNEGGESAVGGAGDDESLGQAHAGDRLGAGIGPDDAVRR